MASLSELLDALHGLDVDGGLVAEALWLARHIDEQAVSPATSVEPPPGPESETVPPPAASPSGRNHPLVPREPPRVEQRDTAEEWRYRPDIDVPTPSPIDSAGRLLGELRPMARRIADPRQREFDEEATVDRAARTSIVWPVTRPLPVRQREAALVFDRHSSMAAWSGLVDAVRTLVDAVGFRRVTVWYLDADGPDEPRLAALAYEAANRPLATLNDPSGRRVVMVFSTCLGDAWVRGTAAAALERLAGRSPVAVVQPLPNHLWRRTGLDWEQGRLTPVIPDHPSPLRVLAPADGTVTPVPVIELTPGWLGPWAQLLAGERHTVGYPLLRRPTPNRAETARPLGERQDAELGVGAVEQVRRFRTASSPDAFRLAAGLAQVPLLLPIMRLIQQAVLPGTGRSVLAEVLAGGLIEDATGGSAPPYTVPEDSRMFVFRPGVADVLRNAIPRSQAAEVLTAVSRFIAQRYDVPGSVFRATISQSAEGRAPFAYLSPATLRRIAPNFPAPLTEPPSAEDERRYADAIGAVAVALRRDDGEAALEAARHALQTLPGGHPRRSGLVKRLTALLRGRWDNTHEVRYLDEAIAMAKMALLELADDTASTLIELGDLLLRRYEAAGGPDFLTDATRVLRTALDTVEPADPVRPGLAERLGDVLVQRCEGTGEPLHGWEAVDWYLAAGRASEDDSARPALMFKVVRAYLDIVAMSAYPQHDVETRIVEQFGYGAAGLTAPPPTTVSAALLAAAERAVYAVRSDTLPVPVATRLVDILATVPGVDTDPALSRAHRILVDVVTSSDSP